MLDGSSQRREGALVAELAPPQRSIEPEQQVGAALVGAEGLDEVPLAVGTATEVGRRTARVHTGGREVGEREADDRGGRV